MLLAGTFWGEDMIVSSAALRDKRPASCLTYLEIATLARSDLEDALVKFPNSEREIRISALKIAMQRAAQIIADHLQAQHATRARDLST